MLRITLSTPSRTFSIVVQAGTEVALGAGGQANERIEGLAPVHLRIRSDANGEVTVTALAPTMLNGVQMSGAASLRAGDELAIGDVLLLCQAASEPPERARRSWDSFVEDLKGEGVVVIAHELVAALPEAEWADAGPDTAAAHFPSDDPAFLEAVRQSAKRVGIAPLASEVDALEAIDRAMSQLLGLPADVPEEEWIAHDASMQRLDALAERVAEAGGPVLVVGERGAGKTRWAKKCAAFRKGTGVHEQAVEPGEHVIATSPEPVSGYRHVIHVPALRDRRADVEPLAELFAARAMRALGRGRVTLPQSLRDVLRTAPFDGNVRELKVAMQRAALISETDELRVDALPERWRRGVQSNRDLRSSLKLVERETLLQMLGRTGWNVTETARQLGLPRRTVVYRMSRLGLRRPPRA